jgi:hypothetical protein
MPLGVASCGVEPSAEISGDDVEAVHSPALVRKTATSPWPRSCTTFNDSRCPITIPYYVDKSVSPNLAILARASANTWASASGNRIQFVERTTLSGNESALIVQNGIMPWWAAGVSDIIGNPDDPNTPFSHEYSHLSLRSNVVSGMDIAPPTVTMPNGAVQILTEDGELKNRPLDGQNPNDPANPGQKLDWVSQPLERTFPLLGHSPDQLIDYGYDGATVVAWWTDGTRSKGDANNFVARGSSAFTAPYALSQNLGIVVYSGRVISWWNDGGTVMRITGSSTRLDSITGPKVVTLPPGRVASDIVSIGINASTGQTTTLYSDGNMSFGDTLNLNSLGPAGYRTIPVGSYAGVGTAVHEMGHILGLSHEQQRQDRDLYEWVGADWAKAVGDGDTSSIKKDTDGWLRYGGLDFNSLMQYGCVYQAATKAGLFARFDLTPFTSQAVGLPSYKDVAGILAGHNFDMTKVDIATRALTSQDTSAPVAVSLADGMSLIGATRSDPKNTPTKYDDDTFAFAFDMAGMDFDFAGRLFSFYIHKSRSDQTTNHIFAIGNRLDLGATGGGTYTLPAGGTDATFLGVAIDKESGQVYSYFDNTAANQPACKVKRAIGMQDETLIKLDSVAGLACVTIPSNESAGSIVDVAEEKNGATKYFYTFFSDGWVSRGTSSTNLGATAVQFQDFTGVPWTNGIGFAVFGGQAEHVDRDGKVRFNAGFKDRTF